jgi:hypothetical protein
MSKDNREQKRLASINKLGYPSDVNSNELSRVKEHLIKIVDTVNKLIDCSSGETSGREKVKRKNGIVGQIRVKKQSSSKYTLEIYTLDGWKEAKVHVQGHSDAELRFE